MNRLTKIFLSIVLIALILITVLFGYGDIPLPDLKAKYGNPPSTYVQVGDMNVHYRDEGDENDSIPIILIHGTGSSLHTFNFWAAELKSNHRVIRMDLPGYGLTGPFPERNYSIDSYVTFIDNFLKELEIKKCIIAGNSLGGRIAWNYAISYPNNVDKLILIDASGYPSNAKSIPIAFKVAQLPVIKNIFKFITPRFVAKSSIENVYADKSKVSEELVDRYFELTLRAGNRQAFIDRFKNKDDTSAYRNIHTIQQETLVLWGAEDLLIPVEKAYQFHNDLPNDTLVIMENVGHVPMEESPEESLNIVRSFLITNRVVKKLSTISYNK